MAVFLGSCLSQGKLNIVSNRLHHSQTQETVTRDTFSLYHPPPKLQKPVHVTPFPLSILNSRNRYMRHLFTCPPKPQKPLHVTPAPCPTPLPNHRNRYTWHLFPFPPPNLRNRYTWHRFLTPPTSQTTETVTRDTFPLHTQIQTLFGVTKSRQLVRNASYQHGSL